MTIEFYVEHPAEQVHIFMRPELLISSLGHAILHVAILIRIMPTNYN